MVNTFPQQFSLDIVLPCYNPLEHWEKNLLNYFNQLTALLPVVAINLTIINDGSKNNVTEDSIDTLKKNIPGLIFITYNKNMGKGFALRKGILKSRGTYQIYTDIDFPYEIENIIEVYNLLLEGHDIVAGVRKENYHEHLFLKRKIISRASQMLNSIFLKLPSYDTQSGLKGMNAKGRDLFLNTTVNRFLFDTEFLAMGYQKKYDIKLLPVTIRKDIVMSRMNTKVMAMEMYNFIKIFFKSLIPR